MPKDMGGLRSGFKDYAVPMPSESGDWGGSKNGADIPGGKKGDEGRLPEVTFVKIDGAPGVGESAGAGLGSIAGKSKNSVPRG